MLTEHPLTVGHALFRASISHTTNYVTLLGTGKVAPGSRCPLLPSLPLIPIISLYSYTVISTILNNVQLFVMKLTFKC